MTMEANLKGKMKTLNKGTLKILFEFIELDEMNSDELPESCGVLVYVFNYVS